VKTFSKRRSQMKERKLSISIETTTDEKVSNIRSAVEIRFYNKDGFALAAIRPDQKPQVSVFQETKKKT
jgi:hypothetical protein